MKCFNSFDKYYVRRKCPDANYYVRCNNGICVFYEYGDYLEFCLRDSSASDIVFRSYDSSRKSVMEANA